MSKWLRTAVAALSMLVCSIPAQAQVPDQRPVYATIEYGVWEFAPVLVNGQVKGFFCFADPEGLVGDNIPIVWYDKGANGEWTMYGWSDYELPPAVKWVVDHYADPEIFKNYSKLCRLVKGDTVSVAPRNMTDGLYAEDPMQEIINTAEDPVGVMTLLENIGWEAAPGLSSIAVALPDESCPQPTDALEKLLNESAHKLELVIEGVAATAVDCFSFGCTGCVKNYDPMVPDPNGSWIFRYSATPSILPNDKFCYYDFPATQRWWLSGQKVSCAECSGSGVDSTFIMKTVRVGINEECHPPAAP